MHPMPLFRMQRFKIFDRKRAIQPNASPEKDAFLFTPGVAIAPRICLNHTPCRFDICRNFIA
jgi:hypothetical protein